MGTNFKAKHSVLATSIAAVLAGNTAMAQDASSESSVALEEIIVTATKRESSVQDLSVAVTAVTGDQLTELSIVNILDLDKTVPGMQVKNSGNDPVIIMRGAGAAGTNDISVPVYIDGQYRPRAGQALASYLDVERVEVLRGPQGTLFGRNTLGGLVNVIANKPSTEDFEFGAAATLGNYSLRKVEGFVNIPMGDMFAARITASDTFRDPYVVNTFNEDGGLKDADNTYARAQLGFYPSDDFDLTLTATYWEDTANGNADYAYKVLGVPVNPATGATNGMTGIMEPRQGTSATANGGRPQAGEYPTDYTAATDSDPYRIANDFGASRDIKETSFSAALNWDLDFATLRAAATLFDYEEYRLTDSDLSPNPSADLDNRGPQALDCTWWNYYPATDCGLVAGQRVNSKAIQADVNLNSNSEGPLQWTVGYYFYDDSGDGDTSGEFVWGYTSSATPQNPVWAHWLYQGNGGTQSQAIYGQAAYDLTDDLTVEAGLRYSEDERRSYTMYLDTGLNWGTWPPSFDNPEWVADRTSAWPTLFTVKGSEINGKASNTDYKLALKYNLNDDVMVYGSVATGYIGGSPKGGGNFELTDPNTVDAYEIGVKSTLLDGAMRLNASAYRNDFDGLSTTVFVEQNGTILAQQAPGGSMSSQGLEVEMNWQATGQLFLNAGVSFDFSELDEFSEQESRFDEGGTLDPVSGDRFHYLQGKDARFSPDYTIALGASYSIPMGSMGELVPGAFLYHSADYKTQNVEYFFAKQEAYTTLDLRATWYTPLDDVSVQAYAKNVTEEVYLTETTVFSRGRAMGDYNAPRTFGVRVAYNF
ncbi:TonB-dependent receptor [Umboniibacter marinipuniceus]|uniref:Iron complex outermembrane receptor protein n=1 Tax=Umboniibacter marinipuniceus TaxID=569599 RepID=A0A3M0A2V9_9GAMM|nr:TonB-dependent receptor [Umboniibacter marinipuniceus]RMA78784.1 iron complex outermembrane receptor protein [Umboniibacter marinipuniceus]